MTKKKIGTIIMYKTRVYKVFNPETFRFELKSEVVDLTKTIPAQIQAQLEGKPKPLSVLTGEEIIKEIVSQK